MSVDKFKFISPGIFVNEIDNTGRQVLSDDVGPVIIGRAEKGPILQPVRVNSYFDFVNMYGNPIAGGKGGDVSRNGNYTSPTYGAYAAQAWFRNNAPVTFVRLGGKTNQNADDLGGVEHAGWQTTITQPADGLTLNGGAFGLFVTDVPEQKIGVAEILFQTGTTGDDFGMIPFTNGDPITFEVNGTNLITLTASILDASVSPDEASLNTKGGWVTGSTHVKCAEHFKTALLLALTASNYKGWEITQDTKTDHVASMGRVQITASASTITGSTLKSFKIICDQQKVGAGAKATTMILSASRGDEDSPGVHHSSSGGVLNDTLSDNMFDCMPTTGTLAAVWYIDQSASIGLSGTMSKAGSLTDTTNLGSSVYIDSVGPKTFKVQISSSLKGVEVDSSFNFSNTSDNYIRKVFNTNPILTNSDAVKTTSNSFARYWLGESYEGAVDENLNGSSHMGVILPLVSGSTLLGSKFKESASPAKTGFFFSQDVGTGNSATSSYAPENMQNLFRLVSRDAGSWLQRNVKVSIKDIRAPKAGSAQKYGSFSVVLRDMNDTDNRLSIIEQFNNCNLNPNSQNFIGRKIGNKRLDWDDKDRRYRELGEYDNRSRHVWVECPDEVLNADTDPEFLPFGVRGPLRFMDFNDATGSWAEGGGERDTMVSGNLDSYGKKVETFISGAENTNGAIQYDFPVLRLRGSGSEGHPVDPLNVFYGVDTTFNKSRYDASTIDHLKIKPTGVDSFSASDTSHTEESFHFTLDDMCALGSVSDRRYCYKSGSRAADGAKETMSRRDGLTYVRGTGSYREILDAEIDQFTTVFAGGFDGLDIREAEPMRIINDGTHDNDVRTNYMFNSLQVAIDSIRDPEVVEYNLAAMPGVKNSTLNLSLIDMCESRGDAMAIVDIDGGYTSQYESTENEATRRGSVSAVESTMKLDYVTNSSYGAAYYPWVQVRDLNNGQSVWMPPSVVAIGAMSYSQKSSELWFAPAGFTRGGLSSGVAGLPVVGVRDRLTSRDRDKLYEVNVNPIAQFPAEGIVIFGQKTLQTTATALDRINVRRLMIFLKRQISRYAATILFDQNVKVTWNRFKGQVEPFLRGVQAGLGITEFKLVLDDTTTTPDLVDRNIVYAKIYIKPARAIEYIAIDFILTDTGAAFED